MHLLFSYYVFNVASFRPFPFLNETWPTFFPDLLIYFNAPVVGDVWGDSCILKLLVLDFMINQGVHCALGVLKQKEAEG